MIWPAEISQPIGVARKNFHAVFHELKSRKRSFHCGGAKVGGLAWLVWRIAFMTPEDGMGVGYWTDTEGMTGMEYRNFR
jgi:hypothetical protein